MAKPIRNTPILYGKDAKLFLSEIEKMRKDIRIMKFKYKKQL